MKDTNIQWHPGFIGAMNLELAKNRNDLLFEKEYNLNTKPLEIDLLVIRKNADIRIENEIGKIFRGHNILEYKSPKDELDIDAFYKASAYACLYKSYGKTLDAVRADDVTVSLVRKAKPYGLFRYFREHQYPVSSLYRGIYYVEGKTLFPTQIVVTKELNQSEHVWLSALSDGLEKQNLIDLLKEAGRLRNKADKESARAVLEVGFSANQQAVTELIRGGGSVSEALMEILEPIMEPRILLREQKAAQQATQQAAQMVQAAQQAAQQAVQQNIKGTIETLRYLGHDNMVIKDAIKRQFGLSEQETEQYL